MKQTTHPRASRPVDAPATVTDLGDQDSIEERFLILAPTREALLSQRLLANAGIGSAVCADMGELCRLATEGGAGLLLADDMLVVADASTLLRAMLAAQPTWSDLPVAVFTRYGDDHGTDRVRLIEELGIVIVLERPLRPITMISAARAALRVRRRQYAARAELAAQRRAVRDRDQFLAMLGHELRNPLSAITMALEAMEQGGHDLARCHAIMRRQAGALTRLVDDLLDVARVTSGKVALRRERGDLTALVAGTVHEHQPQAETCQIDLSADIPEGPLLVTGDSVRIEQVLVNLLVNALKYTPPGGHVQVTLSAADEDARLAVTDDGAGIAPEMLPRIFDLFSQASTTLDRAGSGLGVGLTLVRSLVEHHGGTLIADSAGLGRGSSFTVTLPRRHDRPRAPRTAEPCVAHPCTTRDILIAEDDRDNREILSLLLQADGHHVGAVGDGLAAVDQAATLHPDVMIIDIGLPGIDGYEVARRVRERAGSDVFLIALTGYGQPRDRRRAFEAGFQHHFTKPVDLPALRQILGAPELEHTARQAQR